MNDVQRAIYQSKSNANAAPAPPPPPYADAAELLEDAGSAADLSYIAPLLTSAADSLAILAARMASDRAAFQAWLQENGVEALAHRQAVCNALARGVRIGRITKGWETAAAAPSECSHCGTRAGPDKKLSTCARCKAVKYCSVACQKKAWAAGHKNVCQKVASTPKPSYGYEGPTQLGALPPGFGIQNETEYHAALVDAHKSGRVTRAVDGGYH